MLGFPLLYFKGMRLMMFQLSGFYSRVSRDEVEPSIGDLETWPTSEPLLKVKLLAYFL